jgi:hypothetical protein
MLTRKELRERNGGKDALVVVRPRICAGCGHVWEPPLTRGMCLLVAGLAGVGTLIGVVIVSATLWLLVAAAFSETGGANTLTNRIKVSTFGLLGLGLAGGGFAMTRKYLRLAREQATGKDRLRE